MKNIRRLERENEDLIKEVKSQEEKCVNETAENTLMSQLKQNRKEIVKINQMLPESTDRKSVLKLKQIIISEKSKFKGAIHV